MESRLSLLAKHIQPEALSNKKEQKIHDDGKKLFSKD